MTEGADYSYSYDPDDDIRIDGEPHDYIGGYAEGHLFKRPGSRHKRFLSHADLIEWTRSERITVEKRRKSLSRQRLATAGNEIFLARIPEAEQPRLQYEYELLMLWRQFRQEIPDGHTTKGAGDALDLAYDRWVELRQQQAGSNKPVEIFRKVGRSTIFSYDQILRSNTDSIMDLRDLRRTKSGNFQPKLDYRVESLLQQAVYHYLHNGEPISQSFVHSTFLTPQVYDLKVRMLAAGEKGRFETPSLTTLKARIAEVDKFHQIACRYDREEAERRLRSKGQGLEIVRPGGRSEVDGWTVHLHVLLGDTEVWAGLSPQQIAALRTVRITVVVILDRATRSITGVHFSWSENKESMIGAIRLALIDKTHIAKEFGCTSTWPQRSDGNIVGDLAKAFKADETARVILNSLGAQQFTIPARPWLKGAIEAFFKRSAHDFVQAFLGVAWTDPEKKNTVRSISKANVSFTALREKFIRWVVDDYHHSYQPELGMTPFAAWHKASFKFPPSPPMPKARISAIFGRIVRSVKLSGAGVRIGGNDYHSREVQRLLEVAGETYVDVSVDDFDLGQVSVQIPQGIETRRVLFNGSEPSRWLTALGPRELAGISSWQMSIADEHLLMQFGADAATSEQIRNAARQELLASQMAAARRSVFDHGPSPDLLRRFEEGFHPGLRFATPQPHMESLNLDQVHAPVETGSARAAAAAAGSLSLPSPGPGLAPMSDAVEEPEIQIRFASDEEPS